jgi:integrase
VEGGKRKSYFAKTRQEAARKLTEALRDRDKGLPIVGERQTVGQFLTSWIETVGSTIEPTTLRMYAIRVRRHIIPAIGKVSLAKLSPQQVQQLYTDKLKEGLSTTTVHHIHTVLSHALSDALRLGLVPRNVTAMVDAPRKRHVEIEVYLPDEARRFLGAAGSSRLEALFVLALTTGMRQGELLALKWDDINLTEGYLQVRRNLKRINGKLVVANTKTRHSRRRIALTPLAIDALARRRARQAEERLKVGAAWRDYGLVFTTLIGDPIHPCGFNRDKLWPIMKEAGLRRIRFHDLRHTAATLMLLQGVHVKVVSEMLGHSSVSITLDLYGHVLPDMQRQATTAIQRLLEG